jgi:ABC-type uncharacterized transport system permease subunit
VSTPEPRTRRLAGAGLGAAGTAIAVALVVGAALVLIAGADLGSALDGLVRGAVGDRYHLGETLVQALPLAVVGIGVAVPLRAGVFSVGAQGQMTLGAIGATTVVLAAPGAPAVLLIPLGLLAGAALGAVWSLAPAVLRVRANVNEILSTLLLNYLAVELLAYLLRTSLRDPAAIATPQSKSLPTAAMIPTALGGTRLHWGLLVGVAAAIGLGAWIRSTRGFAIDILGVRPALARRMGVDSERAILGTMLVAGAAAGAAGWMQVAGLDGRLYLSVGDGVGFLGIVVAVLGGLRPLGIVLAALTFAALQTGADGLQIATAVPDSLATVVQAVLLLAVAVVATTRRRRGAAGVQDSVGRVAPAAEPRLAVGRER